MGNGCGSQKTVSLVNLNKDSIPNFKIILLGDSGTGKSSISLRLRKNQFRDDYKPTKTLAIDNVVKKLNVPYNILVSMTIWEIPSREDIDMGRTYYQNVDAAFVVVDLSDRDSVEMAGVWRQDFINKASRNKDVNDILPNGIRTLSKEPDKHFNPKDVPIILLGNKLDRVENDTDVDDILGSLEEFLAAEIADKTGVKSESVQNKEHHNVSAQFVNNPGTIGLMQKVEKQYQFTTSTAVSAKLKDGSLDEVFQALIRHLLDQSHSSWPREANPKNERSKSRRRRHPEFEMEFEKLAETGQNELDELFHLCNVPMKRCQHYQKLYEGCLRRFMLRCVELGLLADTSFDLQQCMTAVKKYVWKEMNRPLLVKDEENFVKIYYDIDETKDKLLCKQQRVFNRFFERFHKEYVAVCRGVIQEGPSLSAKLQKLQDRISSVINKLQGSQNSENENVPTSKDWTALSQQNISRLEQCAKIMEDTIEVVESAKTVIRSTVSSY